ncbi:hypothetical protein BJF88_12045 [Cellulosimicrobium sp. CUA-896]|nr:hypothetical protein BJF88_12045 [Cellulosimicrobium sp. CUA-896]
MSVMDTAARIRSGSTTARAVAEAALARADAVDPAVRSLVWRDDVATLAAADKVDRAVDRSRAAGAPLAPFAGVPLTVKDTFSVAGQRGRAARSRSTRPPPTRPTSSRRPRSPRASSRSAAPRRPSSR